MISSPSNIYYGYIVAERHICHGNRCAEIVGLTDAGIEILVTTFQTNCADH